MENSKSETEIGKVLGFTKQNEKYQNVPDKLKWAIPIHEAVSRPEVKRQGKLLEVLVDQQLRQEEKQKRKQAISLVPKPGASSGISS